jgi:hypothetical protein
MGRPFIAFLSVCVFVLALVLARVSGTHAETPQPVGSDGIVTTIPGNMRVPESLRPILEEALRHSPTFRRQVQELRRTPRVRMAISYGSLSIWHVLRAESTMYRHEFGAVDVDTRLYTVRDAIEVVAHELEHVCEQIEGVDVRALSHRRNSGVYTVGTHFETRRAVLVGRQVAQEALGVNLDATLARHTDY